MTIHVVKAGETVGSIAEFYGVDPARLASDNGVPASGALAVGQTLVVRFPRLVHAVEPGDVIRHREPLWDHSPVPVAEQLLFEGKSYDPGR